MKLNINIKVKIKKDNKTKLWLVYSRKHDVSSYGKTKSKAKKMFIEQIIHLIGKRN